MLRLEWNTTRVREDESGDSEGGEDELSCVIGGEGEGEGDCIWWGSWTTILLCYKATEAI